MNKRTIIAIVIIGVIILFYDDYLRLLYPPGEFSSGDTTATTEIELNKPQARALNDPSLRSPEISAMPAESKAGTLDDSFLTADIPERRVTVETDAFRARLSNYGARLVSFVVKPNGRYLKREIELLPETGGARPGFRMWTIDGPVETEKLIYEIDDWELSGGNLTVRSGQERRVSFLSRLGDGKVLRLTYTFKGAGYSFVCGVDGEGLGSLWVRDYGEAYFTGGLRFTEADTSQDVYYSKAYTYYAGDVLEDLKVSGKKELTVGPTTGDTRWSALRTKYFLAAIIPEQGNAVGAWMENRIDSTYIGDFHPNRLAVGLRIPLMQSPPVTPVRVFIGPLDEDVLVQVDPSLKKTMNWGFAVIAPFSKLILWGLKHLHGIVPNYGICIIIFSVLIKLIIWPLTHKSYQSMAAMGRLQPKLQELRARFKNDAQRLQKEMMKLYKTEKVNPMGGCLPMVLQMPLLWALFIVFRSTIEFRRAPFMWWIDDLSMPDVVFQLPFTLPLYGSHVALLPILMGVSSYFQTKMTMVDPNQRMMLYMMPVFLTLIFNQFPSGLTLYYTLFNIWTLVQQKITPPPTHAMLTASDAKAVRKSKV